MNDLASALQALGLHATAAGLEDLLATATEHRFGPRALLEHVVRTETAERAQRSLERRTLRSRIGTFKPITDFDWNWPRKIDRSLLERALTLDFVREGRNLILLGPNGVGKTLLVKNIAYQAVLAGYSVLFRTAAELLDDVHCDSPELRRRRIAAYTRPQLLCVDLCGVPGYVELA
jgi:DNA replication protein DnaC